MKTIQQLLATKKHQEVISIAPHRPVFDALVVMAEYEIGALMVLEGDKLVGIFSERDYAREVVLKGKSSKTTAVSEVMTANVISVKLGDTQSIVFMLKKLHNESDKGLKVAFASALSLLNAQIAIDDIMQLLEETNSQVNRDETALSVARLVGSENRYIRLQRRLKKDTATTAAQTVLALRKFIGYPQKNDVQATELAKNCAAELAEGNIDAGISLLTKLVKNVPAEKHTEISLKVVNRIIAQLEKCGSSRPEYLTLLLHTILTALKPDSQR